MRRLFMPALATLLLLDFPALAQIGTPYPGGYPPGGYPPGQYPGGRGGIGGGLPPLPRPGRKSKPGATPKDTQEPLFNVTGVLRKIDESSVVVEAQDTRIINLKRTEKTRFLKHGKEIKPSDLKAGDHLLVESKQDDQGFFFAVNVIFDREGTPEEQAAASAPVGILTPTRQDDDERPVLGKKTPPRPGNETPGPESETAAPNAETETEEAAAARPIAPPKIRPLPEEDEEPVPVLRRRKPGERKASTPSPSRLPTAPPVETASTTPPRPDPEPVRETVVIVEKNAPSPPDPVIEKAREMALSFTKTLPNYYCRQLMTRFVNTSHQVNWQPQDVVSAEVIFENHRERYRNIAINGKPTKRSMQELPGAWSTGEFGTVLADLFSPGTAAEFFFLKEDQAAGRLALVYDFAVERQGSHWHIQAASQSIVPAYRGALWIDKKSHQVLRIEMQAKGLPSEFPFDKVESAVDYQYVRLGGESQFLLPVHAESLICQRGTNLCSRNLIDFRNYHKYTSESTIIFNP